MCPPTDLIADCSRTGHRLTKVIGVWLRCEDPIRNPKHLTLASYRVIAMLVDLGA
jgi:hypothetical protein